MTEYSSVMISLKSIFPESSWPWVFPALNHDPLIWNALADQEFFSRAADACQQPEDWTPHRLAAIALHQEQLTSLPEELESQAQAALSQFLDSGTLTPQEEQFEHAALIGAALYGCVKAEDWQDIEDGLRVSTRINTAWFTPMAVLLGMVSDQAGLLSHLLAILDGTNIYPLIVHMVLSQPHKMEQSRQLFWQVLESQKMEKAAALLEQLHRQRPEMSMILANEWLQSNQPGSYGAISTGLGDQLNQVTYNLLAAQIYTLAGQLEKAEELKSRSLGDLRALQIEVSNQLVGESLLDKNIEYALTQWTRTTAAPKLSPPAGLVVDLLKAGRIDDSLTLLPDTDGNTQAPLRWLNNIFQALENDDVPQARLFAHQALKSFSSLQAKNPAVVESMFGSRRDLGKFLNELTDRLADLALYKEAFQTAEYMAKIMPGDTRVLMKTANAARAAGEHQAAIEAAQYAVTLKPTLPEYRRQLAKSLEAAQLWNNALPERKAILEHRFASGSSAAWPVPEDLLAYASCAIHAGEPAEAYDVCQKAIDIDPSDGQAHAVYGEALSAMGDDEQAMEHFALATQLAPHKADPWLSLARAYQRTGNTSKSIETLRTASHAVPDDPGIFLELGKVHLAENSPSQAQSAMERAYHLVSQPLAYQKSGEKAKSGASRAESFTRNRQQLCEIALIYGEILETLGHADQASQVFENAYQAFPAYPGLAYVYAKSLLVAGDQNAALAPLAIAVSATPPEAQPYIEYARALLHAGKNPEDAVSALEKALKLLEKQYHEGAADGEKTRYLAGALLAQAHEAAGELVPALHKYTHALETPIAEDESWKAQLSLGLGRVAIQLEQPEVAIAALQDPNHKEIHSSEVARILCEAYSSINLTQEALYAARSAVHLSPDDVEILAWFADQAVKLGVVAEAVPALTSAAQLDPQRTDLIIRLAQVQTMMGKTGAAREAYQSALSSPYSTPENLYKAADGLSDLGENEAAAACLERAFELQPHPPLDLIIELSNAYKKTGKSELAIKTLDTGIDQYAESALLHTFKADLLNSLGRNQAARACLEHALILDPNNPEVHLQIAFILRDQDELHLAFEHALVASRDLPTPRVRLAAIGLVIELARSTLQESQLADLLETARSVENQIAEEDSNSVNQPSLFDYYCVQAEIALDFEEQISAATALNAAFALEPDNPRLLALQSRMALRQGDREAASNAIKEVTGNLPESDEDELPNGYTSNALLGISLALMDLYQWDHALQTLQMASAISAGDSYLHLQKARLLVLQAEFQRLCQFLDIVRHAPGGAALSPRTRQVFEETIQDITDSLSADLQADLPGVVKRWKARGEVAFQYEEDLQQVNDDLPQQPSDQAAMLSTLSRNGDTTKVARLFHSIQSQADTELLHHSIYASYALALITTGQDQIAFEQAAESITAAIDQHSTNAIYHVIHARAAQQLGDWQTALHAMQTALSLWSDEPRWQAKLGDILLFNSQYPEAVLHYLSAIEMESGYLQHYIDLSQAYLSNGEPGQAISTLQNATKVAPDKPEAYLALAGVYYEQQNFIQAKRNADMASRIAPKQPEPLLMCAQIALKLDDPGQAQVKSEAALDLVPDDPRALLLLAKAFSNLGDPGQAMDVVETAIPLADDPLPLYLLRAELLAAADDSQRLLPELKSIADQYPGEPLVLAPLSKAFADANQKEEAIQAAQQALQRNGGEIPLDEQAQLHHMLGRLLRETGQLDQSIHQLSEAIRIAPQSLNSFLELGLTQEERRQFGPALETYKKAINSYPADSRPYYQAALLLKSGRDYPAAETMLRKAAERDPENVEIHRQLAALVAINLVHSRQAVSPEM